MFGKKDDFPSQVYLVKAEDLSKPLVIPSKVRLTGSYDPTVPEDRIKYIYRKFAEYGKEGQFIAWLQYNNIEVEDLKEDLVEFSRVLNDLGIPSVRMFEILCFNPYLIAPGDPRYSKLLKLSKEELRENYRHIAIK